MEQWTFKYAPKTLDELPQRELIRALRAFVKNWKAQKRRAVILAGPVGVGKTVAVHLLTRQLGWELVEVNASDTRNADQLQAVIGNASRQQSLFYPSKIILIDEVDGIAGTADRGGVTTLAEIVKGSAFPVVMTANDPYDSKFSPLRKLATVIDFPPVALPDMQAILARICVAEGIVADEVSLRSLCRRCGGDMRGAITDLQTIGQGSSRLSSELVSELSERDKEETMQAALVKVLKQSDPVFALSAFEHVAEDLDEALLWLEQNVPIEYTRADDRARAMNLISRADVFRGRIRRWQHWRFLAYVGDLLTAGVVVAKSAPYRTTVAYEQNKRILNTWILKRAHATRDAVVARIAEKCHCSLRRAKQEILPFVRVMSKKQDFGDVLGLSEDETVWLRGN